MTTSVKIGLSAEKEAANIGGSPPRATAKPSTSPVAVAGRVGIRRAIAVMEQGIVDWSKAIPGNKIPSRFPPKARRGVAMVRASNVQRR